MKCLTILKNLFTSKHIRWHFPRRWAVGLEVYCYPYISGIHLDLLVVEFRKIKVNERKLQGARK